MAPKWSQFEGQQKAARRKLKANASNETHDFIGGGAQKGMAKGVQKVGRFLVPRGPNLTVKCGMGKIGWANRCPIWGSLLGPKKPGPAKKTADASNETHVISGVGKPEGAIKGEQF